MPIWENAIERGVVMEEKRLNIGLFVCHLENEFSAAVSNGAMIAAEKLDANLIIFPGRYINGVYNDAVRTEYEYQYNTIFNYASSSNLDVLLVMTGTIGGFITKEQMKEILDKYKGLPIITLASEIDTYPCLKFDNTAGLREGIEHLIHDHKKKKIAFVSGPTTNEDAQERLAVYAETMVKNGFKYDAKKVCYGDFSEYSYNSVVELLRKNKNDIDAIVFANDKMAIGGYRAIADRGLKIGEDIAVMGFDDSPIATSLMPALTTVRADASELGYRAVVEGINLIKTGKISNATINTTLITRNSCGCKEVKTTDDNELKGIGNITSLTGEQTARAVNCFLFDNFMSGAYTSDAKNAMLEFSLTLLKSADEKKFDSEMEEQIRYKFRTVIKTKIINFVSFEKFRTAIDGMYFKIVNALDDESRIRFNTMYTAVYKTLANVSIFEKDDYKDKVRNIAWMTSSISRDILAYANDDQNKYGDIIDKLMRLDVLSSYLYTFEDLFAYYNHEEWITPETVLLKAYHNDNLPHVITEIEEQKIPTVDIFHNKYTPNDRRHTMILNPLISQEEHFGLLLTELDYENFCFVSAITVQICAALKIISLLKSLEVTQKQLEESLTEIRSNNVILNKISRSDELTGIYNRRGFFETSHNILTLPQNAGKNAVLVFADMDGLKVINDMFGHDEGDYSLKQISYILQESFRSTDVVGRIGGDEFSALAIVNSDNFAQTIKKRIKDISANVNKNSGKPYYINMSVGVVEFICDKNVDFQALLDQADMLLYKEKKNKNKIIIRDRDDRT